MSSDVTVADLHARLARLIEQGRGGDEVALGWTDDAEEAISEELRDQLQVSAWVLRGLTSSDDADYFTILEFEPTHPDRVQALIEASSVGTDGARALRASVPDEVAVAIVDRSKQIAVEVAIEQAWERAADGCLKNLGHRKQDPCRACVTAQLTDVVLAVKS